MFYHIKKRRILSLVMRLLNRITHLKEKLIYSGLFLVFLILWYVFSFKCVYLTLFNITCPGCGMIRAYGSLLHGQIGEAFRYNFMFWSIPICWLYIMFDGKLFNRRVIDTTVLCVIAAGFIFLFVARLFGYFSV